jgi:TolB protein
MAGENMGKIKWIIAGILLVLIASTTEARVYLDVYGKTFKRITIAAPTFKSDNTNRLRTEMSDLLNKDLDFSGFFIVAPQSLFDRELSDEGIEKQEIKFGNWRSIGVELLCKARLQEKEGGIFLEAFVYDTLDGSLMLYKRYKAGADEWRGIVHKLADAIILTATGEKGIMESKILFVSGSRSYKELYLGDIDGTNVRRITSYKSITLSPSISPNGRYMSFTSYKEGRPNLYVMDLSAKREVRAEREDGMKTGTNWMGKTTLTYSHTSGRNSTIYALNVENGEKKVLLRKEGILTSPSFSPDGSKMVYVSDMYGHPQVFIRDTASGEAKRLTYSGKYNTSPVFSPKGDLIAFVSQLEGSFEICTMNQDGSNQKVLTNGHGAVNDSPQFSPCGRYIVYSSRNGGRSSINIMLYNGENNRRIKFTDGEEDQPKFMP